MPFSIAQISNIRKAFQSILRADYISISDIEQLKLLDEYYVDYFKNLAKTLQMQDSYINGRRGSGKTVLLMRAYYECLKTVSPKVKDNSDILQSEKILPIYIDLSQCKDIFGEETDALLEKNFVLKLVDEFKRQLKTIFEEHSFKFLSKNFSELNEFEQIKAMLTEGVLLQRQKNDIVISESYEQKDSLNGKLNAFKPEVSAECADTTTYHHTAKIQEKRGISVQNFLSFLGAIRRESKLDAIYVFIDEFSDLTENEQEKFSILLKKLLGSKNNIFFKVGTITDRFYFGESIIVGRDIYPISLDLNDFVERYGGITVASKELQRFTQTLVEKRLETYTDDISIKDLFGENKEEIFSRISREAMGVPRTIGLILQVALAQVETRTGSLTILLSDVNVGIRETRKTYFKQFQGAVQKRVIPGFYMDMWNSLLGRALDEKKRVPNRPASHFMVDPVRKKHLNVLCENFIVHCLEDSRASKYGGNYVLFAIDYDICNDNNIAYADDKDEFTAARFIYDGVLQKFDGYFLKDKIKSYRCPDCNKIYEESDVAMMKKKKRCFDCDCELEEIIHRDTPISEGNYTEVEVKILGIIATLNEEDAMSASQIGEAVGCNYQKVSNWCSKVLQKQNLISVTHKNGKNYYYDYCDET